MVVVYLLNLFPFYQASARTEAAFLYQMSQLLLGSTSPLVNGRER